LFSYIICREDELDAHRIGRSHQLQLSLWLTWLITSANSNNYYLIFLRLLVYLTYFRTDRPIIFLA